MHPNEEVITRFYTAFQNKDHQTMAACYDDDVEFSDPVFRNLRGVEARAMWQMLLERGTDLTITFSNVKATDDTGSADWVAVYTFSKTKRRVRNVIHADFQFKDNKIVYHRDSFDLWKWAGMALGPVGKLLGFTPFVQGKVRAEANLTLEKFLKKHNLR
ncbi:MAG: nuclear transport factor 2 family protein [Blastocatellia bacterium]|nr:nuclear transport factor 2 family protein [Blastocatellia bacterium]